MTKTHHTIIVLTLTTAIMLSACSFSTAPTNTPEPSPDLNAIASQVAQEVVAGLTATAAAWTATPSITPTTPPAPTDAIAQATATNTETETPTLTPTSLLGVSVTPIFAGATVTPDNGAALFNACYNSELVRDVTVPRGEEHLAGSSFLKAWEIKNIGTCTWNANYSMTFGYSTPVHNFYNAATTFSKAEVKPGETVLITIAITLPTGYPTEGAYNIGYRLANDKGYNFGAWFFVYVNITPPSPTP